MVSSMALVPLSAPGVQGGVAGPATNLNIGMEYWGTAASPTVPIMRGKVQSTPIGGGMVPARDGVQSQLWLQVFFYALHLFFFLAPKLCYLVLFYFYFIAFTFSYSSVAFFSHLTDTLGIHKRIKMWWLIETI